MQSEIVAKVTEPKREPRPTTYAIIVQTPAGAWSWLAFSHHKLSPESEREFLVTIPGELESARLARIKQARDVVIDAAIDAAKQTIDGHSVQPGWRLLVAAVEQLETLASQESSK